LEQRRTASTILHSLNSAAVLDLSFRDFPWVRPDS
jgi:hypothetical protein